MIEDVKLFAYEQWYSGSYTDSDGRSYDIVFTRNRVHDIGYEHNELANVLIDGETANGDDLWKRVRDEIEALEVGEEVKLWLIDEGYQPQYGARPMRRTLQKLLGDPLSEELIKGRFKDVGKIKVVLRDSAPFFIEEEVMASV